MLVRAWVLPWALMGLSAVHYRQAGRHCRLTGTDINLSLALKYSAVLCQSSERVVKWQMTLTTNQWTGFLRRGKWLPCEIYMRQCMNVKCTWLPECPHPIRRLTLGTWTGCEPALVPWIVKHVSGTREGIMACRKAGGRSHVGRLQENGLFCSWWIIETGACVGSYRSHSYYYNFQLLALIACNDSIFLYFVFLYICIYRPIYQ